MNFADLLNKRKAPCWGFFYGKILPFIDGQLAIDLIYFIKKTITPNWF
jgi:hypothetical protein